jgi:HTH-type transcriptional regulator/antitoxin HigA
MKLDGITTKLPNGIPVIGLSFRYPRYDHFWFTLLHALAHVSLHYSALDEPICDDLDMTNIESEIEAEANRIAADMLIPRHIWNKAEVHRSLKEADLMRLASDAAIHPAVAAGMIRRKNANYRLFSNIVNEIDTRHLLGIE